MKNTSCHTNILSAKKCKKSTIVKSRNFGENARCETTISQAKNAKIWYSLKLTEPTPNKNLIGAKSLQAKRYSKTPGILCLLLNIC